MSSHDAGLARIVEGVLLPGFDGTVLPGWLAERLAGGLAGVFCFAHNVAEPAQLSRLTAAVHDASPGALVASDEEGGDVTRLEHRTGSSWPGAHALGRLDDTAATERLAQAAGAQARAVGIDLVAAPVADVHADPANPVIGIRSFGSDPALVSRHVAASVRGFQAVGLAACAKHWPGHGSTHTDSHRELPVVSDDEATIRARDLPPFAAAVDAGVRAVMTAHIRYPAVDDEQATLSSRWVAQLRTELGFEGVLVSDALDMAAITVGRGEGAVRALEAGVDLLCLGNPLHPQRYDDRIRLDEVCDAVRSAISSGRLPRARVEEAADRVSALGADPARRHAQDQADPGAARLAHDVLLLVAEAQDCVRVPSSPHVLDLRAAANVAAGRSADRLPAALTRLGAAATQAVVDSGTEAVDAVRAALGETTRPIVAVVEAPHRQPRERELLAALTAARPDAVVVQTGLGDGQALPAEHWLRVWGSGRVHADVAAELLLGRAGAA